jgi:hypothetical protein
MAKPSHRATLPLLGAVVAAAGMLLGSLGAGASPLALAQAEAAGASTSPGIGEALAPSTPSQINLGEHLRQQGYLFYGAWWCPACFRQKSLFGQQAGNRLPYVECDRSDGGRQRCEAAAIKAYPTWVKGNERREGVLSLEELARWSGWNPARTPIGHGNGSPAGGMVPGGTIP